MRCLSHKVMRTRHRAVPQPQGHENQASSHKEKRRKIGGVEGVDVGEGGGGGGGGEKGADACLGRDIPL